MSLPACPPFADFYEAVTGNSPFPWQDRLALRAAESDWPQLVNIQTGLGKTACMDAAVWALASQADRLPHERTAPTRLWWVVNHRLLVDDTYEHARRLAEMLADSGAPDAVQAIAARLDAIAGGEAVRLGLPSVPLEAWRLRAGEARNRPSHPAQPAVICSTVPMYGSRLLFRGYGSSKYLWPVDAALAGTDSLVLIDEAHTAHHLGVLIDDLQTWAMESTRDVLPGRPMPQVVRLTATGDAASTQIDIEKEDRSTPIVVKRLKARKPMCLHKVNKPIVEAATKVFGDIDLSTHRKVLIFVNSPRAATELADKLSKSSADHDVLLATGRMRDKEARATAHLIKGRLGVGAEGSPDRATVVVSTQTLEVGADLDADCLLTERCGARALIQRLGRLNRQGEHRHARADYIECLPPERGGVYGSEPDRVWERLDGAADADRTVDMSLRKATKVLGPPTDTPLDTPVLPDALLDEWVKTTFPTVGEAPVEPFFTGYSNPEWTVCLVWRAHVPAPGERIWPPVSASEVLEVRVREARRLAGALPKSKIVAVGLDGHTAQTATQEFVQPGTTLLVSTTIGGVRADGHYDSKNRQAVVDVAMLENGLPLTAPALKAIEGRSSAAAGSLLRAIAAEEDDDLDLPQIVTNYIDHLKDIVPPAFTREGAVLGVAHWEEFTKALEFETQRRAMADEPLVVQTADSLPRLLLRQHQPYSDASDSLSFLRKDVPLDKHLDDTARRAAAIAQTVGVTYNLALLVEQAAQLHDIGKAEPRFQRWMRVRYSPGDPLLAKSKTPRWMSSLQRRKARYPRQGRHEEHSRRLVESWLGQSVHQYDETEAGLLQHLVVAHHGRGRPMVLPVTDDILGGEVSYTINGVIATAERSLALADWDQPERFRALNQRYGRWGLAYLETLIRQADWLSSARSARVERVRVR